MAAAARILELPKRKTSFMDAVKKTVVEKEKKGKSSVRPIQAPDNIKEEVSAYLLAKDEETKAKAEKEMRDGIISEWVREIQDDDGFKGDFTNSYALTGTDGEVLKYIASNRFTINSTDADAIREILGRNYESMIKEKMTITIKPEILESEELQGELMEMVGDRFGDFFQTEVQLGVKEKFDEKIYAVLGTKEELGNLRVFCKQYKASLRG